MSAMGTDISFFIAGLGYLTLHEDFAAHPDVRYYEPFQINIDAEAIVVYSNLLE